MPILAAADQPDPWTQAVFAGVCLVVGLGVGLGLRLFRPGRLDLPDRVPPQATAWPLAGVLGAGLFVWFAVPVAYFSVRQAALAAREGPQARVDTTNLSPRDLAFAATVPPAAGMLALLAGDRGLRRALGIDLGFGLRGVGRGVLYGLLGSLSVVPLIYGCMVVIDWLYRAVGYEHPREHDLLRALGESGDRPTNAALIVGATLMAPLFEELLFRGHLQTVLRRAAVDGRQMVIRLGQWGRPVFPSPGPQVDSAGPPPVPLSGDASQRPTAWETWAAIVLTSALFALVHPAWTWPAIFLLSLCLGYAYERTGNLWVPIVIHAAFNSTSTVFYLLSTGAN